MLSFFQSATKKTLMLILTICSMVSAETKFEICGVRPGMQVEGAFHTNPRLSREPVQLFWDYNHIFTKVYLTPSKDLTVIARDDVVTIVSGESLSIEESKILKVGDGFSQAKAIINPQRVERTGKIAYFYVDEYVIRLDFEMNEISRFYVWEEPVSPATNGQAIEQGS